jgi:hypothetical protein
VAKHPFGEGDVRFGEDAEGRIRVEGWRGGGWTIPLELTPEQEKELEKEIRKAQQWILKEAALELIESHCRTTRGHAQDILKKACKSWVRHNDDIGPGIVSKDDLQAWLNENYPQQPEPAAPQTSEPVRRGRRRKHDWPEAKAYTLKLLEERGDPTDEKNQVPGWETITDLVKAVQAHKYLKKPKPDFSTTRKKVTASLRDYQRRK